MKKLLLLIIFLVIPSTLSALDAFPSAVGEGRDTVGGRSGTRSLYIVTNLNNSGSGSFREAIEASGPRYVTFAVSGDIHLTALLEIDNPYITIAGETSPGGIAVSGEQFNIDTYEVIIRHMRFRNGTDSGDENDSLDILGQGWGGSESHDIILDHVSVTWGVDETLSVTGGTQDTTIQYCLIGAGSHEDSHSKGLMISGKYEYDTEVSLYRNFFPGSNDRNPLVWNPYGSYSGDSTEDDTIMEVEATNNVSYNWYHGQRPMFGGWRSSVNWIGNYSKGGPDSYSLSHYVCLENCTPGDPDPAHLCNPYTGAPDEDPYEHLYMAYNLGYDDGNYGDPEEGFFGTGAENEWLVGGYYTSTDASTDYQLDNRYVMDNPLPFEAMTITLAATIVAESGATVPVTDSVDQAQKDGYTNGTALYDPHSYPSSLTYPDDWPTYSTPSAPTDSDSDGMSDSWETSTFGSLAQDFDGDYDSDGYDNIEEYFHYLSGDTSSTTIQGITIN